MLSASSCQKPSAKTRPFPSRELIETTLFKYGEYLPTRRNVPDSRRILSLMTVKLDITESSVPLIWTPRWYHCQEGVEVN